MYPMNPGSSWDTVFKNQENGGLQGAWDVEEKYELFGYGKADDASDSLGRKQLHERGVMCVGEWWGVVGGDG